jgi:hypothetical protein
MVKLASVLALLVVLGGASAPALASTIRDAEFICPLTGEKFTARIAGSGTSFGSRLDLRPVGPIASPWPLAKCPDSGFPLFERAFSDDVLAKIKAFVATPEYKALRADHADYYVVARLQARLGYDPQKIAFSVLAASWEAESANSPQLPAYLQEARQRFSDVAAGLDHSDKLWPMAYFLSVELARRLGMFEEAGRLLAAERANLTPGVPEPILALEEELIRQRETKPDSPAGRRR